MGLLLARLGFSAFVADLFYWAILMFSYATKKPVNNNLSVSILCTQFVLASFIGGVYISEWAKKKAARAVRAAVAAVELERAEAERGGSASSPAGDASDSDSSDGDDSGTCSPKTELWLTCFNIFSIYAFVVIGLFWVSFSTGVNLIILGTQTGLQMNATRVSYEVDRQRRLRMQRARDN